METRPLVALALLLTTAPALAADSVRGCLERATTQVEVNRCGSLDLASADQELNAVYQAVLRRHRDDAKFIERLRAAQRAWIRFRDAEMEAFYPHKDTPSYYGSMLPLCWSKQLAVLTYERTRQLRRWLDGVEEGDACAGSVPIR